MIPFAGAAQEARDSAPVEGHGRSYWGVIPPATDEATGRFRVAGTPLWEYPLLAPYWAVRLPVEGLGWAGEGLLRFGARSELVQGVVRFFVEPRRVRVLPSLPSGGLSGTGGGASFHVEPLLWAGSEARGRALATLQGDLLFHGAVLTSLAPGGQLKLGGGFRRRRSAEFFGIGPDSRQADFSVYEGEEGWVGSGIAWELWPGLAVEGDVILSRAGAFPSDRDEGPALEVVFQDLPTAFGRYSDGLTASLAVSHETTSQVGRPTRGGVRKAKVSFFRSLDEEFSNHWIFRAEAQQFISLVNENQVLALRGFASWIDPTGDEVIPFQRLMTNDAPDLLRGHEDFRFWDRGMAVFSAEYRWPLWVWAQPRGAGVDMYLLTDVGQVFGSRDDLALSALSTSYGVGLRLVSQDAFLGLLEVARSEEEWVVRLTGEQIFQFAKGGIYHGRGRVPRR